MTARGGLIVLAVLSGAALFYFVVGWRLGRMLRRNVSEPFVVYPDVVGRDEFDVAVRRLLAEEGAR